MRIFEVNNDAVKSYANQYTPKKTNGWLKLDQGEHMLRLLPPFAEDGVPFRKRVFHQPMTDKNGRKASVTCLDFIYTAGIKTNKLDEKDFNSWKKYGCPACKFGEKLKNNGSEERAKYFRPQTQYTFNVLNRKDGQVYKWSTGVRIFNAIEEQYSLYPKLYDLKEGQDFKLKASGEGLARRYVGPNFVPMPTEAGLEESAELWNLDEALDSGVFRYSDIIEIIQTNAKDKYDQNHKEVLTD